MEDVNCDKVIDRPIYSDRVCVTLRQSGPLKTQLYDVKVKGQGYFIRHILNYTGYNQ